ncbi:MAG: riboflavin synthase [Vicinamibacterales bacterium]
MFTGLIEALGRVAGRQAIPGGERIRVETALAAAMAPGDSVATNGVCLTVVETVGSTIAMDVSPETLRVTNLGELEVGRLVNLERPVRPQATMGGHFVQGHVDTPGRVIAIRNEGEFWRVCIEYPEAFAPLLIPKGSVAVDGISLTVASLEPSWFDVQIIPFTWEHTNLQARAAGERVNLEGDMLGKYVLRLAELGRRWSPTPEAAGA